MENIWNFSEESQDNIPEVTIIAFSEEISEQIAREIHEYLHRRVFARTVECIPLETSKRCLNFSKKEKKKSRIFQILFLESFEGMKELLFFEEKS